MSKNIFTAYLNNIAVLLKNIDLIFVKFFRKLVKKFVKQIQYYKINKEK